MSKITKEEKRAHEAARAKLTNERKLSFGQWAKKKGWRHAIGLLVVVYAVFPLVYVISGSFADATQFTSTLFTSFTTDNYRDLFSDPYRPFGNWFVNTLFISGTAAIGSVFLSALAAYAFSRLRFTGRRAGLLTLILVQMFPQLLALVAIYALLVELGNVFPFLGIGSQLALIMVYLGGALGANTYLMYGFFNTIPKELDEAAKIDGATHTQIFYGMILRLSAPILAVIGLLAFIGTSSDFILANIILTKPESKTLAVGLYMYVSDQFGQNWTVFAAGAVLAAIPIVALFLYLQKYIVSGLTGGAVKG
ncbi:MAG: sugar ABC transporter permease [Aquiluna sp.]|jgi:arabinogalactan oligomer/maltooligosaccharide transport system permease protein|uniref:sugar ABC transporter permease n=1 Tax=Aquiluna sp. TaxID=2053504 RepID=UPI00274F13BA|nr:sugar ABC transporter permease [Aquiluna sp.]MDP4886421.1 sugar ABC transporter permease [Aquiluna sp.]MDP5026263.1 sugar ABC transporter permease [Aquiluna sp.]